MKFPSRMPAGTTRWAAVRGSPVLAVPPLVPEVPPLVLDAATPVPEVPPPVLECRRPGGAAPGAGRRRRGCRRCRRWCWRGAPGARGAAPVRAGPVSPVPAARIARPRTAHAEPPECQRHPVLTSRAAGPGRARPAQRSSKTPTRRGRSAESDSTYVPEGGGTMMPRISAWGRQSGQARQHVVPRRLVFSRRLTSADWKFEITPPATLPSGRGFEPFPL